MANVCKMWVESGYPKYYSEYRMFNYVSVVCSKTQCLDHLLRLYYIVQFFIAKIYKPKRKMRGLDFPALESKSCIAGVCFYAKAFNGSLTLSLSQRLRFDFLRLCFDSNFLVSHTADAVFLFWFLLSCCDSVIIVVSFWPSSWAEHKQRSSIFCVGCLKHISLSFLFRLPDKLVNLFKLSRIFFHSHVLSYIVSRRCCSSPPSLNIICRNFSIFIFFGLYCHRKNCE